MSEENHKERSTSILELLYLFRAMNRGDMSFSEGMRDAVAWAHDVITEQEAGQPETAPPNVSMQSQAAD